MVYIPEKAKCFFTYHINSVTLQRRRVRRARAFNTLIVFTYEMKQFPVLFLTCCLNLFMCDSFSSSVKMKTIPQHCIVVHAHVWVKRCVSIPVVAHITRELLFYWCPGIYMIRLFAWWEYCIAHAKFHNENDANYEMKFWDLKSTSVWKYTLSRVWQQCRSTECVWALS